ncbi:type II toxin-antitoxin system death-on-curing family toxin [Acidovorax sp. BLS4]|uniref:type II toxin-antitoxin system death-on-curing family toxin n=1 Tax=Acidovorax sp. BLS4 TaxID=3273430 RepID=UPI002943CA3E|nr:type II toxin-antitoxin system death-on-curing family toxin [Paracidovorax avenae]WOI45077.1 type II toxin-antitoxin system death-on-curing family toxin [Paracidovorax avenae]
MDASTIVFIHEHLTEFFEGKEDPISPPGVKDMSTIQSAAARPNATVGGNDAYPTHFMKAAALFHSIAGNHSFHNGNKRAALLSTLYYLSEFGYWVEKCNDEEMYEFTRQVAAHEIAADRNDEVPVIAEWLERNSRKQQKGEKPMKLGALRDALARYGFELHDLGKTLEVLRDGEVITSILKKGAKGFEDYDPAYIAELRKRLELIPEEGVDSARFYGQKGITDELNMFMQLRLEVMKRLAKI